MKSSITEEFSVTVSRHKKSGHLLQEIWRKGDVPCNSVGPAIINYEYKSGRRISEHWLIDGVLSRPFTEGPALIHFSPETGNPTIEIYQQDGVYHRLDGPAKIYRSDTGKILQQEYYYFGYRVLPCPSSEPS